MMVNDGSGDDHFSCTEAPGSSLGFQTLERVRKNGALRHCLEDRGNVGHGMA